MPSARALVESDLFPPLELVYRAGEQKVIAVDFVDQLAALASISTVSSGSLSIRRWGETDEVAGAITGTSTDGSQVKWTQVKDILKRGAVYAVTCTAVLADSQELQEEIRLSVLPEIDSRA